MTVHIDNPTIDLAKRIETVTNGEEFSMVMTALELALARRIARETLGRLNGLGFEKVAASLVGEHIDSLLSKRALLDA